jgi:hypothetical protein
MGLIKMSTGCSCTLGKVCQCGALTPANDKNPDPYNFSVIKREYVNGKVLALIRYPNCTNYEGKKILVLEDISLQNFDFLTKLDPHFMENGHLVARFRPDCYGMAYQFCLAL